MEIIKYKTLQEIVKASNSFNSFDTSGLSETDLCWSFYVYGPGEKLQRNAIQFHVFYKNN